MRGLHCSASWYAVGPRHGVRFQFAGEKRRV